MAEKFKNKYRISSTRLPGYDYGRNGAYFVTMNTKYRHHYFGNIVGAGHLKKMIFSEMGRIANEFWMQIPGHFNFVRLDAFQVMPDHLHGIIIIDKGDDGGSLGKLITEYRNAFAPQSKNLASIIRGFKAGVKTFAVKNNIPFFWQERFHDHIIQNQEEFQRIRKYILENVSKWKR